MNSKADTQAPVVVLLVEDEALVRMIAADGLQEEGFKVLEAAHGEEALSVLQATPGVRALITDVEMPGPLNGFALARLVKQRWPHIGIVIMSGRMAPGPEKSPMGAQFLPKPFTPANLVAAVQKVLGPESATYPSEISVPVLPAGITATQPHIDIGTTGSLAQPLPEPDE